MIFIDGIFSDIVRHCTKHLARMISSVHLATLEAGALPSPCGREGNRNREVQLFV